MKGKLKTADQLRIRFPDGRKILLAVYLSKLSKMFSIT